MASGEFLELAQRAARAARFDPSDATDLARAKEAVNEAYLTALGGSENFDFLKREGQWVLTAGSDKYTFASIATAMSITGADIAEILYLTNDTDGYLAVSMSWAEMERLSYATQDGDADGLPMYWAQIGGGDSAQVRLYPNPDSNYTLGAYVRLIPAEMSADADEPLIPLQHRHAVLVPHAAANLLRQEGGGEAHNEAQLYERQYDKAWQRMRTAHATASVSKFRLKAPTWDTDHGTIVRGDPWSWTR